MDSEIVNEPEKQIVEPEKMEQHHQIDQIAIHDRIDNALVDSNKLMILAIRMALGIFIMGCTFVLAALSKDEIFYSIPATVTAGLLYWPINKILKVRKENLLLRVIPAFILLLPPKEAAKEISKFLERLDV